VAGLLTEPPSDRARGVDTSRIASWSAAAAAFFASASGWIIAVGYGGVSFYMGTLLGLKALFASIIGGFGTIEGAIVGGSYLPALKLPGQRFPDHFIACGSFPADRYAFILTGRPLGRREGDSS
jgi:branched-chain amino acid transport system permease protein